MKKYFSVLVSIGTVFSSSITVSPDTLSVSLPMGDSSNENVMITNLNDFDVHLDISIFEQTGRSSSNRRTPAQTYEPDPSQMNRDNIETDIQYRDENSDWVDAVRCATPSDDESILQLVQNSIENNRQGRRTERSLVNIQVAWHVLHNSSNQGYLSQTMIDDQIQVLNDAYAPYDIFFTLVSVDYTMNDQWFGDMDQYESTYKQQLNIDPVHHLNIYSGNMPGLLGWSYLPYSWPENHYMHGVCLLYSSLPGGTSTPYNLGDTATHEVGHYLGLLHTFQDGCSPNNDYVADTPQEDNGSNIYNCNNTDTCPNDPGMDPVHNFMTYTNDACLNHFSDGQGERMNEMIELYRPGLLENPVSPDWVYSNSTSISIPANSSVDLEVIFDSEDMIGGQYSALINLEESTMDTLVMLPAYMNVEGVSDLTVSFESLVDTLYPNEFTNNFLQMVYSGSDQMIYEFTYDVEWVTVYGGDGTLDTDESQFVTFILNSLFMDLGTYEGEVTLNTNMGSMVFPVTMVVVEYVGTEDETIPLTFSVSDNFPNPFNPSTRFSLTIPDHSHVRAVIYDMKGREVNTLINGSLDAGKYDVVWNGQNKSGSSVSGGVYILQVIAGSNTHNQKMILMK